MESLPIIRKRNRYIVIAIDYFFRWSEARIIKVMNVKMITIFIYKEIICWFRHQKSCKVIEEYILLIRWFKS